MEVFSIFNGEFASCSINYKENHPAFISQVGWIVDFVDCKRVLWSVNCSQESKLIHLNNSITWHNLEWFTTLTWIVRW